MAEVDPLEPDLDLQTQQILLASSQHDLPPLKGLLRNGSASVQDPDTGFTPLHAAIAACEPSTPPAITGVHSNVGAPDGVDPENSEQDVGTENTDEEAAAKTVRLLLQNGAIWNDVDRKDETPGCLARRLGLKELYEIMVDAGVRAEMLFNRLDEYEMLRDQEEEEEAGDVEVKGDTNGELNIAEEEDQKPDTPERPGEETGTLRINQDITAASTSMPQVESNNNAYLQSPLTFEADRILDSTQNGVMMAWETTIMQRTADLLAPRPGLRILNIGHGMGIIDNFFQSKSPSAHHIIEAHPSVIAHMKESERWYERPNVTIHEGKWQSVLPKIMEQGFLFDVIYFDTFAEDYKALRDFFSDFLIGILDDGGKWGFFNGLGADRQVCYDVYGKVVEMDLFEAGFDTIWETVKVKGLEKGEWEGVKRRYWVLAEYKLPICEFIG